MSARLSSFIIVLLLAALLGASQETIYFQRQDYARLFNILSQSPVLVAQIKASELPTTEAVKPFSRKLQ